MKCSIFMSRGLKECRLSALARVIYFRVEHTWVASQNQALLQLFAPVTRKSEDCFFIIIF